MRRPREFGYAELRSMPSVTVDAAIECAGNGRSFFATQQGRQASGTQWGLGAVGVARWRGVPLSAVLRRAGLSARAVDVMPSGLDANFVSDGVDLGRVRRPLPIDKALDDVLLAYEMNGEPLPPDHGFPVRVVVPSWVGIASIKWVGDVEVSAEPLSSPWNIQFYRLFGPGYPDEGTAPLTEQVTKSAFELPWEGVVPSGSPYTLHGRSWSGRGRITRVEVSTDGGTHWRRAKLLDGGRHTPWTRWHLTWPPTPRPPRPPGPRHRRNRHHPAFDHPVQRPGLPVRRHRHPPGTGDLTPAVPAVAGFGAGDEARPPSTGRTRPVGPGFPLEQPAAYLLDQLAASGWVGDIQDA